VNDLIGSGWSGVPSERWLVIIWRGNIQQQLLDGRKVPIRFGRDPLLGMKTGLCISAAPRCDGSITVLVVEDEEAVRAQAIDAIEEFGYRVLAAGDGTTALDVLAEHPEIEVLNWLSKPFARWTWRPIRRGPCGNER
jgi:hypothetical protein